MIDEIKEEEKRYRGLRSAEWESEFGNLSEEELEDMNTQEFSGRASIFRFDSMERTLSDFKEISEGKSLWKYFVLLALLFILCEILIIKFMR